MMMGDMPYGSRLISPCKVLRQAPSLSPTTVPTMRIRAMQSELYHIHAPYGLEYLISLWIWPSLDLPYLGWGM